MFNFIFDGRIGDILAPVVPTNKLFLAIQHHKNDEVNQLILNNDMQRNADGGYSAIHVACRYNNRYALETILSRGVSVEFPDQSGNTPLHYACRYGNIDICKFLIELGASVCRKNNQNQTPYDVAGEHHIVRQYLLPLQFQAERSSGDVHPAAASQLGISTDAYYNSNASAGGQYMTPAYSSNPTPPPQTYGAPPVPYYNGMTPSVPAATGTEGASPAPFTPAMPPTAIPPPAGSSMPVYNHSRPAAAPTNTRIIQPDGFHSSASDPALQKKYGHIQQTSNIAPPPTSFPAPSAAGPPGAYGGVGFGAPMAAGPPPPMGGNPYAGGGVYSRYVPYDAHTNSAAPLPSQPYSGGVPLAAPQPQSSMFPSFPGMSRSAALPTHCAPSPSPPPGPVVPSGPASGTSRQASGSSTGPVQSGSVSPVLSPPSSANSSGAPSTAPANRLLGNKALAGGQDILASTSSDPRENDVTVITASSTSSAVL